MRTVNFHVHGSFTSCGISRVGIVVALRYGILYTSLELPLPLSGLEGSPLIDCNLRKTASSHMFLVAFLNVAS